MVDFIIEIVTEIIDFFLNLWTDKLGNKKRKRSKPKNKRWRLGTMFDNCVTGIVIIIGFCSDARIAFEKRW